MNSQSSFSATHWFSRLRSGAIAASFLFVGLIGGAVAAQEVAGSEAEPIAASQTLPGDGIYLYGQSAEPEQIGQAYMVFEARQGKVVGAFYMPRSSFDCFYGDLGSQQMALKIVDSYGEGTYDYAIALEAIFFALVLARLHSADRQRRRRHQHPRHRRISAPSGRQQQ